MWILTDDILKQNAEYFVLLTEKSAAHLTLIESLKLEAFSLKELATSSAISMAAGFCPLLGIKSKIPFTPIPCHLNNARNIH